MGTGLSRHWIISSPGMVWQCRVTNVHHNDLFLHHTDRKGTVPSFDITSTTLSDIFNPYRWRRPTLWYGCPCDWYSQWLSTFLIDTLVDVDRHWMCRHFRSNTDPTHWYSDPTTAWRMPQQWVNDIIITISMPSDWVTVTGYHCGCYGIDHIE